MLRRIVHSPRRRRIVVAVVAGGMLTILAIVAVSHALRPRRYTPGERVEGIERSLDRSPPPGVPTARFTDVTREAGIGFVQFGGERSSQLPEDMASGAAWGDFDGDGFADLYLCAVAAPLTAGPERTASSSAHNRLFRNRRNGAFEDVTARAGVGLRAISQGAAWGDYDGDGRLDLAVTSYGRITLYRNNGDGTFADHSREAGVAGLRGFWTGLSWADYDRDGRLDLYVCGYVRYRFDASDPARTTLQYNATVPFTLNPSSYPAERNLLLRNKGDGTFQERGGAAGVANPTGRSLSAAWCDFDLDGWPDLYVANDVSDNALFRNLGNGKFEDLSHPAWVADYRGAMGLAVGDWDNDGDPDVFVTHWIAQESALYENQWIPRGGLKAGARRTLRFIDVADQVGLGQISLDYVKWGTSFFDYDNDGRLDLVVANGSTFQDERDPRRLVPMRHHLFWNRGAEGFYEVGSAAGEAFSRPTVGRGLATADFDNDGDVDVLIVNHSGEPMLLRNDGARGRHWLTVRVRGRAGNPQGIMAKVRIEAGGHVQTAQLGAQPSYLSQDAVEAHFGLGEAAEVDCLEVVFPSGRSRRLERPAVDRILVVEEPER